MRTGLLVMECCYADFSLKYESKARAEPDSSHGAVLDLIERRRVSEPWLIMDSLVEPDEPATRQKVERLRYPRGSELS